MSKEELFYTENWHISTDESSPESGVPGVIGIPVFSFEPIDGVHFHVDYGDDGSIGVYVESTDRAAGVAMWEELTYKFKTEQRYRDLLKKGPYYG